MARQKAGLSQAEYARRIGKSRQYVCKLVKLGKLPVLANGRIDPQKADAVLAGSRDPARQVDHNPLQPVDRVDVNRPKSRIKTFHEARTEREKVRLLLDKAALEERLGQLVRREEVKRAAAEAGRQFMTLLLGWPSKLAPMLAHETDERRVYELLMREAKDLVGDYLQSLERLSGGD